MTDRDAATLTKTPPTTIDAHLEAHFAASAELTGADKLSTACWTAKLDMLNKLKEIRAAAAWRPTTSKSWSSGSTARVPRRRSIARVSPATWPTRSTWAVPSWQV